MSAPPPKPTVTVRCVRPGASVPHRQVQVTAGTRLIHAVRAAGLPVGAACDLDGVCAACGLRILDGAEHLSTERPLESAAKSANGVDPTLRLSCLARVHGPVTVTATYW